MLIVAKAGYEDRVKAIFEKWDLEAEVIGHVSSDGRLKMKMSGEVVVDIAVDSLVVGGGASVYRRRSEEPSYLLELRQLETDEIPDPSDYNAIFLRLLSSPNITSKKWVYRQYDKTVRTNTLVQCISDAAVIRLKGT
ncbi:MAG: AIR synthase-related protein [Bacteroidota bacterium]